MEINREFDFDDGLCVIKQKQIPPQCGEQRDEPVYSFVKPLELGGEGEELNITVNGSHDIHWQATSETPIDCVPGKCMEIK